MKQKFEKITDVILRHVVLKNPVNIDSFFNWILRRKAPQYDGNLVCNDTLGSMEKKMDCHASLAMTQADGMDCHVVLLLAMITGIAGGISEAQAQVCATQPSCESLGFTQKATDCTGKQLLKCPFDTNKVFCGGSACDSGYIYSSCSTDKGTCEECGGLYKYTSCKEGWEFNSLKECIPSSCSGAIQPSSDIPHCIKSHACKSGYTTTYGCSTCEVGYEYNLGACTQMDCYNNCYYEQGIIDDSEISAMTPTKPTCNYSGILGCFRNGTMVYMCNGLGCL